MPTVTTIGVGWKEHAVSNRLSLGPLPIAASSIADFNASIGLCEGVDPVYERDDRFVCRIAEACRGARAQELGPDFDPDEPVDVPGPDGLSEPPRVALVRFAAPERPVHLIGRSVVVDGPRIWGAGSYTTADGTAPSLVWLADRIEVVG